MLFTSNATNTRNYSTAWGWSCPGCDRSSGSPTGKSQQEAESEKLFDYSTSIDKLRQELNRITGRLRELKIKQIESNRRTNELQL